MAPNADPFIEAVEKSLGAGTVYRVGDVPRPKLDVISTGILPLDLALGIGGWPRGRIIELYGPESSGKSTIGIHAVAEAQRAGLRVLYVDSEHAMDFGYMEALGVNVDELLFAQPDTGEQALDIVELGCVKGQLGLIVVDSVDALTPRAVIEGGMSDAHVGLHARLMSQGLRKLVPVADRANTAILFINQIREKVGVVYGSPEVTPGGRALKFYSSIRADVRRVSTDKNSAGDAVSNRTKVKIVKNKVARPYTMCEFDIEFGLGVADHGLLDVATEAGIIKKSGAWFTYDGEQLGQGKAKAKAWLMENEEAARRIDAAVREHYELKGAANGAV